jgi:hypothetical protein
MAEPRRNAIYPLIKIQDDIFGVSWSALKEQLKVLSNDEFTVFLEFMSDTEWLSTLDHLKIEKIVETMLCSVTLNQCNNLLNDFMRKLENRRISTKEELTQPGEEVIWNIYTLNREVFEFIAMQRWRHCGTRTQPQCIEEKNLCLLEIVLTKDFFSRTVTEHLLIDASVDHKAGYNDLLDIILDSGHIEYLHKVFDLWMRKYGQDPDAKQKLREFVCRKTRRWIYRDAPDQLKYLSEVMQILTRYEIPLADVVFNPDTDCDILCECKSLAIIQYCIRYLPVEIVKDALQKRGYKMLFNIIEISEGDHSEELDSTMAMLEKEGVDMNPIFLSRVHCDRLTLLDYACLHRDLSYVKVIMNRMSDPIKKELLFTINYGHRNPLDHAMYYNWTGKTTKEDYIKAEMFKFIQ